MRFMNHAVAMLTLGLCLLSVEPSLSIAQSRDAPIPHAVGQSVTPSFEGWYQNLDGTFSLSFGYMNRNREGVVDLAVGASNLFSPGAPDRGQPTHFLSRRQTGVFTVTVPADFGDQQLTWTLVSGGETIAIPGHLRPEWEIDTLTEITSGNTPPRLKLSSDGSSSQGPNGPRARLSAEAGLPVELNAWVTDDGVKKRPSSRRPQLGVSWSKYRGPGAVSFDTVDPSIAPDGHAVTSVTFDLPGSYMLRALAWDESGAQGAIMAGGFQCCWTNGYIEVTVSE